MATKRPCFYSGRNGCFRLLLRRLKLTFAVGRASPSSRRALQHICHVRRMRASPHPGDPCLRKEEKEEGGRGGILHFHSCKAAAFFLFPLVKAPSHHGFSLRRSLSKERKDATNGGGEILFWRQGSGKASIQARGRMPRDVSASG